MNPNHQHPDADPNIRASATVERMLDEGEKVMYVLKRHPIGLVIMYVQALIGVAAVALVFFLVGPEFAGEIPDDIKVLLSGVALFGLGVLILIMIVATYIYKLSQITITNKEVVQVLQRGLFSRKVSRLDLSNVEDVTADQHGILQSVFNYGTLTIQTAGELENFIFPYCPHPNTYADEILDARQEHSKLGS